MEKLINWGFNLNSSKFYEPTPWISVATPDEPISELIRSDTEPVVALFRHIPTKDWTYSFVSFGRFLIFYNENCFIVMIKYPFLFSSILIILKWSWRRQSLINQIGSQSKIFWSQKRECNHSFCFDQERKIIRYIHSYCLTRSPRSGMNTIFSSGRSIFIRKAFCWTDFAFIYYCTVL